MAKPFSPSSSAVSSRQRTGLGRFPCLSMCVTLSSSTYTTHGKQQSTKVDYLTPFFSLVSFIYFSEIKTKLVWLFPRLQGQRNATTRSLPRVGGSNKSQEIHQPGLRSHQMGARRQSKSTFSGGQNNAGSAPVLVVPEQRASQRWKAPKGRLKSRDGTFLQTL